MLNKILTLMRENEGMTIHEVASKLCVSSEAALDYELGKVRPTPEIIKKYSEIFGVPVSSIMFFSKEDEDGILSTESRMFFADKMVVLVERLMQVRGHKRAHSAW
ncbi:helix-turn-helix transcriptional regulator [uncultured Cohaesibacter sp.]|uniref:helix-turn-helix domain-containing protein n=1 Tax=uncultured Cohaesibacter sp. TaxID=1002546 RepID=UPI002A0A381B|nr:helix-turn-helix transcriptional regulator [uncultured Cohaesibacter sp.]